MISPTGSMDNCSATVLFNHAMHRTTFPFAVTGTAPRGSVCTVMVNAAPAQSLLCQTACARQRPYWGRSGIAGPDG